MTRVRSIGTLTLINLASGLLAIANSIVLARLFGTSRILEIFFAASTLQQLTLSLAQTGQLSEILIPQYHQLAHSHSSHRARELYAVAINWFVIAVTIAAVLLWSTASWLSFLLVPGFDEEARVQTATTFRWLLPMLPLQVFAALQLALSNAEKWFGKPELVDLGSRTIILFLTLMLGARFGIAGLVTATWAGQLFLVFGYALIIRRLGYRHRFILRAADFKVSTIAKQLMATSSYVGATQIYTFSLNAGLSLLPQGTYAVFKYVMMLYAKTNGILIRPVSTVFLSYFSSAAASNHTQARLVARQSLAQMLGMSIVITAVVWVAGPSLIGALWGGDKFTQDNVRVASFLLTIFYALLGMSALGQITRKISATFGFVGSQYISMSVIQGFSAMLAWYGPRYFGLVGAVGVLVINGVMLPLVAVVHLYLRAPQFVVFYPRDLLWRWGIAGAFSVFLGSLVADSPMATGLTNRWLMLTGAFVLGALVMGCALGTAYLLRIPEVRYILSRFRLGLESRLDAKRIWFSRR